VSFPTTKATKIEECTKVMNAGIAEIAQVLIARSPRLRGQD